MAESFGIQGRGAFYDQTGAIRDVLQNHLMQLLERSPWSRPIGAGGRRDLRDEQHQGAEGRCNVWSQSDGGARTVRRLPPRNPGVKPRIRTVETYVALKICINSWRWKDVPFYIRTGKSLPVTATEVVARLRRPSGDLLQRSPAGQLCALPREPGYVHWDWRECAAAGRGAAWRCR